MSWTKTSLPATTNCNAIVCTANGSTVFATVLDSGVYKSIDSGDTWTLMKSGIKWTGCLACNSSDGSKVIATQRNPTFGTPAFIFQSNDGGTNWVQASGAAEANYVSLAASSDGTKLFAMSRSTFGNGIIQRSINNSAWQQISAVGNTNNSLAQCMVCDSTGTNLFAVASRNYVYKSSNSGDSWTQTSLPLDYWYSVACSSDGSKVIAVSGSGPIYTSNDGGQSWTYQTSSPTLYYVACNSNRTTIVGALNNIYVSKDSGSTWTVTDAPQTTWNYVTSSETGVKMYAAANGGAYKSANLPPAAITNYSVLVNGVKTDLNAIFAPLSGTATSKTEYVVKNYDNKGTDKDLSELFEPYVTGGPQAATTNYKSKGKDLNEIFAKLIN